MTKPLIELPVAKSIAIQGELIHVIGVTEYEQVKTIFYIFCWKNPDGVGAGIPWMWAAVQYIKICIALWNNHITVYIVTQLLLMVALIPFDAMFW